MISKKMQEELNLKRKEELEMKECSFQPMINQKSYQITQSTVHVPIHERPLPEKKYESNREMLETERIEEEKELAKSSRKADPAFYERQLNWLKKNEEKNQNQRLQKQLSKHSEIRPHPKINKEVSERMVGNGVDFIERMQQQSELQISKRQLLTEK